MWWGGVGAGWETEPVITETEANPQYHEFVWSLGRFSYSFFNRFEPQRLLGRRPVSGTPNITRNINTNNKHKRGAQQLYKCDGVVTIRCWPRWRRDPTSDRCVM